MSGQLRARTRALIRLASAAGLLAVVFAPISGGLSAARAEGTRCGPDEYHPIGSALFAADYNYSEVPIRYEGPPPTMGGVTYHFAPIGPYECGYYEIIATQHPLTSWIWTFGDGSSGSGETVYHTYKRIGGGGFRVFPVTLTVSDGISSFSRTEQQPITDRSQPFMVEIVRLSPDPFRRARNDGTYFSIPRVGHTNANQRSFSVIYKVRKGHQDITAGSRVTHVTTHLNSASGTVLQTDIVHAGVGSIVRQVAPGRLDVQVTFKNKPSGIDSTPPPADRIVYQFTVEVTYRGQSATSDPRSSNAMHALWKMPDGLPRYGPCDAAAHAADGPGGDDWVSQHTYEWMTANRSLLTAINDASGEHGLNLGHVSHSTGNDLDMFHIYALAGASSCSGTSYYDTLVTTMERAFGRRGSVGGQIVAARQAIENWVAATRGRFDQLLPMPQVRLIIYAKGAAVGRLLPEGWAQELLTTGHCTDRGGQTLNVAGSWGNSHNKKMRFRTDHDNHVHLSLNM